MRITSTDFIGKSDLYYLLKYLDEITVVTLLPFALTSIIKYKTCNGSYIVLGFSIAVFAVAGIISGIVNGNSLLVTSLGIFDYIKNFLVIFVYAAFFRNFNDLKKVFRILLAMVVFLGAISLIQEIWATGARYILARDITDKNIYIFSKIFYSTRDLGLADFNAVWRYGIYKAGSLVGDSNLFGLYSLLFFTLYIFYEKKIDWRILVLILSGILGSISRMIYGGLALINFIYFFRDRKWLVFALIPFLIFSAYISFEVSDLDTVDLQALDTNIESYRAYTRNKSVDIWKDHVFWGVGPGMYGGVISLKFNSHIYEEHNFNPYYYNFGVTQFGSLDQFWPQVLVETGIAGAAGFAGILGTLALVLSSLIKRTEKKDERGFLSGLTFYLVVVYIYLLGSGLNITMVIFTYLALVGIAMGCINNPDTDDKLHDCRAIRT